MSFLGSLFGTDAADASRRAAADTYAKQTSAVNDIKAYGDTLPGAFAGIAQGYSPYVQAGNSSLAMLLNGLGVNGADGSAAFTNAYRATPGYQAGLDAGGKAVAANANAHNMLQSGETLKALQKFGSDYENTHVGDFFQRLGLLQGQGLQATGAQASTMGQGLQGQLGTRQSAFQGQMGSAGTVGQGDIAAANAQAGALGNLMNLGGNLLGIGIGTNWGSNPTSFTNLFKNTGWASPTQRA